LSSLSVWLNFYPAFVCCLKLDWIKIGRGWLLLLLLLFQWLLLFVLQCERAEFGDVMFCVIIVSRCGEWRQSHAVAVQRRRTVRLQQSQVYDVISDVISRVPVSIVVLSSSSPSSPSSLLSPWQPRKQSLSAAGDDLVQASLSVSFSLSFSILQV